jgi:predicted permease
LLTDRLWKEAYIVTLWNDLRHALRLLRKSPGFTTVAVLSLALGIGANTAIYSVINALLLRLLPVSDPERLVIVATRLPSQADGGLNYSFSYPLYRTLHDSSQLLDAIAFRRHAFSFSADSATERINGAVVSGNYFSVLGVVPALGTAMTPEDDIIPGSGGARGPVLVLSYNFWRRRFGGDPSVVGRKIGLNGHPFTVAGVAAAGFTSAEVGEPADVFAPMMMQSDLMPEIPGALEQRRNVWLRIMARLRPGASASRAEAEAAVLVNRFNQEDAAGRRRPAPERKVTLLPGGTGLSGLRVKLATPLAILLVVAGLVLLIACANVANLLLARATARQREIGVRLALGAPRGRLISQLAAESLPLALAGGAVGLALGVWVRNILLLFLPQARGVDVSLDSHVLGFTLLLACLTGLLFGLAPAIVSTRAALVSALKGHDAARAITRLGSRKLLVVAQVALSMLLLVGAGLFLRTLGNLRTLDTGFVRDHVLLATVDPALNGYRDPQARAFYQRLLDKVSALPGVRSASLADCDPLENHTFWNIDVPGYQPRTGEQPDAEVTAIAPGYFATMGIPVLLGRDFGDPDGATAPKVVIVNETFARYFFPGESPVGKRIGTKGGGGFEIVGMVKDSRYEGLRDRVGRMLYTSYPQVHLFGGMVLHVRTAAAPAGVIAGLREQVRALDANLPVFDVLTIDQDIERSITQEKLVATLAGFFGFLALALCATGLYGVMAYAVTQRTREIGIRMALGADLSGIRRLVLRDALKMLLAGAAIGLPCAWVAIRLVSSQLYEVEATDPLTSVVALLVLALVVCLAAWQPAYRATKVDALVSLRYE